MKRAGLAIGGIIVGVVLFCAIFAPWLTPHDPFAQNLDNRLAVPFWMEGTQPGF